jgi:hypothetical protein
MVHLRLDFDFASDLVFHPVFGDSGFCNNFNREEGVCPKISCLMHHTELAFPKQLADLEELLR